MDQVVPHDPTWAAAFAREAQAIAAALGGQQIALHHMGSTAIAGILAKPIIDLLGVTDDLAGIDRNRQAFESLGYEVMGAYGIEGRRYFRKVDGQGRRTHHLHIYAAGSAHIERHLAFRDYLRAHPERAAAYSELKARLTAGSGVNWEAYLDGKAPFIQSTEQAALAWSRTRRQQA
jgi:GrpB-like predicted nucleotidyltransferase (UPF0157 family)